MLTAAMAATERGPLGRVWSAVYAAAIRLAVRRLRRGHDDVTVYARGSFAAGEPVLGLSDVDLVAVAAGDRGAPGAARERTERRWRDLCSRVPALSRLIAVKVYELGELRDATAATLLSHGLGGDPRDESSGRERRQAATVERAPGDAVVYGGHPLNRHYRIRTRPGLERPMRDWRLLAGEERRPARPPYPSPERFPVAWLELQCWWLYAVWACVAPGDRLVPYVCLKLVAEGARIWIWLVHGEWQPTRGRALERGLALMPEDERILRLAIRQRRRLPHSEPELLPRVLRWYVDLSARLGRLPLAARCADATSVRLDWAGRDGPSEEAGERAGSRPARIPLLDWRALVLGPAPDERVTVAAGDPGDPGAIRAAAEAERRGGHVALEAPGLLVLPAADLVGRPFPRGTLRIAQCAATDPVSFALLAGARQASFPSLPGLRAVDWARRAVAEQRARLGAIGSAEVSAELDGLLCLARAALFLDSIDAGEPRLAVAPQDVAAALAQRSERSGRVCELALDELAASRRDGRAPHAAAAVELRDAVARLRCAVAG